MGTALLDNLRMMHCHAHHSSGRLLLTVSLASDRYVVIHNAPYISTEEEDFVFNMDCREMSDGTT
jgi:hypothetical protein